VDRLVEFFEQTKEPGKKAQADRKQEN
jgi:hypothetical protein